MKVTPLALVIGVLVFIPSQTYPAPVRLDALAAGVYDWSQIETLNKAFQCVEHGDYAHARQYYDAAIAHDPHSWPGYFGRARLFMRQRNWNPALQDLEMTIRLKPSLFLATLLRASVNERVGNYDRALGDYEHIISLHPMAYTRAFALNGRAWLRAACPATAFRNGSQAVADAKAACNLTSWSTAEYIDTLAAANAEAGDFEAAVRFEQQALAHEKDEDYRRGYEQRLALYQAHHPFRYASK